jgi:hypothetical protein
LRAVRSRNGRAEPSANGKYVNLVVQLWYDCSVPELVTPGYELVIRMGGQDQRGAGSGVVCGCGSGAGWLPMGARADAALVAEDTMPRVVSVRVMPTPDAHGFAPPTSDSHRTKPDIRPMGTDVLDSSAAWGKAVGYAR